MPRRRKCNSTKKPPLSFEESPLDVTPRWLSPVHSCLNPVTAEVVPVEALLQTWISPQFHDKYYGHDGRSLGRTRNLRHNRTEPAPGLSTFSESGLQISTSKSCRTTKIKPLQFVIDNSPVLEVSVANDTSKTVSKRQSYVRIRQKKSSKVPRRMVVPLGVRDQNCVDVVQSMNNVSNFNENVIPNAASQLSLHNDFSFHSDREIEFNDPEMGCADSTLSFLALGAANVDIDTPDIDDDAQINGDVDIGFVVQPRASVEIKAESPNGLQRHKKQNIVKIPSNENILPEVDVADSCTDSDTSTVDGNTVFESQNRHNLLLEFLSKTPPSNNPRIVILAADTPEAQYGLPHRQKMLLKFKNLVCR